MEVNESPSQTRKSTWNVWPSWEEYASRVGIALATKMPLPTRRCESTYPSQPADLESSHAMQGYFYFRVPAANSDYCI